MMSVSMVLLLSEPASLRIVYGGLIRSRLGSPTLDPLVDRFDEEEGWKSPGNPGNGRELLGRTGGGVGGRLFALE